MKIFKGVTALFIALGFFVFLSMVAHADETRFGGCWSDGEWCVQPTASVFVGRVKLNDGTFSGGLIPGIGYGINYESGWIKAGSAVYLATDFVSDTKSINTNIVFSFMEYIRLGIGVDIIEGSGTSPILLFGIGANLTR